MDDFKIAHESFRISLSDNSGIKAAEEKKAATHQGRTAFGLVASDLLLLLAVSGTKIE